MAQAAKPGQFVSILGTSDLVKRPFTISDVVDDEVIVRYRVIGRGTTAISDLPPFSEVDVIGPLGNGYTTDIPETSRVLIVGGGTGAANIPFLAKTLKCRKDIVIGGKTEADIVIWQKILDGIIPSARLHMTTEDGSIGTKGNVCDAIGYLMSGGAKYDRIYACGPLPMMKAVAAIAGAGQIPCEVALESEMGCSVGVCKSCTCLSASGTAKSVCKDGPVFDAAELDWEYLVNKESMKKRAPETEAAVINHKFDLNKFLGGNIYMPASGCCGFGFEQMKWVDMTKFGAICMKGVTKLPRVGNPGTRIYEMDIGMMNSIGLENPGIEKFLSDTMPQVRDAFAGAKTKIIANFSSNTAEGYGEMAGLLSVPGIDALEVNVSCPNITGKFIIGTNAAQTHEVVKAVRASTNLPVIVKLTPNVSNISEIALAAEEAGADAISLINTLIGTKIDAKTGRHKFFNASAGMSGSDAVKNVAIRMIEDVAKTSSLPIIGVGGIRCAEDVAEFLMAGANAVQIGTQFLKTPNRIADDLPGEVEAFIAKHHTGKTAADLVGTAYLDADGCTIAQKRAQNLAARTR
jgi:dihydroorotate dehydrogenase (NAD+) catalytic subunit